MSESDDVFAVKFAIINVRTISVYLDINYIKPFYGSAEFF